MRVLAVTFPWPSHHFQMVPTEWALRASGHEICVASTPSLVDTIARSGLSAVPVASDAALGRVAAERAAVTLEMTERWPADWVIAPERLDDAQMHVSESLGRMQLAIAEVMLPDLLEFAREWRPDLVLYDSMTFAGPVVAEVLGIPAVAHLSGSPGVPRVELAGLRGEPLAEYTDLFVRHGADPRADPDCWIDPCAPRVRLPVDGACHSVRFVPYTGIAEVPRPELTTPRRRICVTWGGAGAAQLGQAIDVIRQTISAAAGTGTEVVVAVNPSLGSELAGHEFGPEVRLEVGVPLDAVIPGCDLVIHHGGAGTSLNALKAGVPQLVIADRPIPALTGARVSAAGAGRDLLIGEVRGPHASVSIAETVDELMRDSAARDAAQAIADLIESQQPPTSVVVPLENLTAKR